MYIRGKDKVALVRAIKEARVDIFGSSQNERGWKYYVGDKKNIVIHDPVSYEEALRIMRRSKIVLNSCPWIVYGGHERAFSGLASGALVITNENDFMSKYFTNNESIVFYRYGNLDLLDQCINEYLVNDARRELVVKYGRDQVMKYHTWDQRAQQLLQDLPSILESL